MPEHDPPLTDREYAALAGFRHALRSFLAFSEQAARDEGLTPAQHQLLLAIRGAGPASALSMSELAERLHLKLHSTGELVDRAVDNGLVERHVDERDARRVRITLTDGGRRHLEALSRLHRRELRRFRSDMQALLGDLDEGDSEA